jgi:hypothetical protein
MQHAKRMILVDEREYDEMKKHAPVNTQDDQFKQLFDRYVYEKLWKDSPNDASRSYLSSKLHSDLGSSELSDDVKAKQHNQTLTRFLNQQQQQQTKPEPLIEEPIQKKQEKTKKKQEKTKKKQEEPAALSNLFEETPKPRRSRRKTRKSIKWTEFNDE